MNAQRACAELCCSKLGPPAAVLVLVLKKWLVLGMCVTACLPKPVADDSELAPDGIWQREIIYPSAEEGQSYICAPALDAQGKDCVVVEALPLLLGCERPGYAQAPDEMILAVKAALIAAQRSVAEYRNYCAIVPLSGAAAAACVAGEATTERGYCIRDNRAGCDATYAQALEFTTSRDFPLPAQGAFVLARCPASDQ